MFASPIRHSLSAMLNWPAGMIDLVAERIQQIHSAFLFDDKSPFALHVVVAPVAGVAE